MKDIFSCVDDYVAFNFSGYSVELERHVKRGLRDLRSAPGRGKDACQHQSDSRCGEKTDSGSLLSRTKVPRTLSVEELRLENHVRRMRQDQSRTLCTANIAKEMPHVVLASTLQPLLAS